MAGYRSGYRAAVYAALTASERFGSVPQMRGWAENLDRVSLPVIAALTPSETKRVVAHGQIECETLLQVVLKRTGGASIEDDLDDDAEAIEALVIGALLGRQVQCFPESLTAVVSGDGQQRTGTVVVNFRVTSWRALGST